jgi:hypothetical protein
MATIYVYNADSMHLIVHIHGDAVACQSTAEDMFGADDSVAWTQSPAFGAVDGVIEVDGAQHIEA